MGAAVRWKLGTRGSPLALWQARHIAASLEAAAGSRGSADALALEIVVVKTIAERFPERPLVEIEGGAFSRELDDALLGGSIDLAVHSLKDLPTEYPAGLAIAAVPPRGSPLDAFVGAGATRLDDLPPGARIGTGSPRRRAQLLARRPDLEVVPLRGNVETRLRKIEAEKLAGTILAVAGLRRLGREAAITETLAPEVLLPAVGQGALAVVVRRDDAKTRELVASLDDAASHTRVLAERAFLRRLRGGCQAPAAALATLERDVLRLDALLASLDGTRLVRSSRRGSVENPEALGLAVAEEILARGGDEILAGLRGDAR